MRSGESFYKLASLQMLIHALVALALLAVNKNLGLSWFLGASVAILPQYVFTRWVFRYQGAKAIVAIVSSLHQAEVIKFVMTALLFMLVLTQVDNLDPWAFFIAFMMANISHLFLALRINK